MKVRVDAQVASSLPLLTAHRCSSSLLIVASHHRLPLLLITGVDEHKGGRPCCPIAPTFSLLIAAPHHCSSLLLIIAHRCSSSSLIAAPHHRSSLLLIPPACKGGRQRWWIQVWTPTLSLCCASSLLIAAPHHRSSLLLIIAHRCSSLLEVSVDAGVGEYRGGRRHW